MAQCAQRGACLTVHNPRQVYGVRTLPKRSIPLLVVGDPGVRACAAPGDPTQ